MFQSQGSKYTVVVVSVERGRDFSAEARVVDRIPAATRSEAFDLAMERTFHKKGGGFMKATIVEN